MTIYVTLRYAIKVGSTINIELATSILHKGKQKDVSRTISSSNSLSHGGKKKKKVNTNLATEFLGTCRTFG